MPIVSGFTLLLLTVPGGHPPRTIQRVEPTIISASAMMIAPTMRNARRLIDFAPEQDSPRLLDQPRSHDPFQFAAVRALRFDRGRYRPSPIDAKLEFRMTGDTASVGMGGAVSKLLQHATR